MENKDSNIANENEAPGPTVRKASEGTLQIPNNGAQRLSPSMGRHSAGAKSPRIHTAGDG